MSTVPGEEVPALTWVERTITVDAIDPAKDAIEANDGWRLLHVGMGSGGQTTLTFGWPWPPRHRCTAVVDGVCIDCEQVPVPGGDDA